MKKVYHLSTCSTCIRMIKEAALDVDFEMQDIKTNKINAEQLKEMHDLAGNYEALFSRRALKYKAMGLKDKNLTENDYRDLILEEYTFLKRPVVISENQIVIGNSNASLEALKKLTA